MNREIYDKVLHTMKQLDAIHCREFPTKIEFELDEKSAYSHFPAEKITHQFVFAKYKSVEKTDKETGYDIEVEHRFYIDGRKAFEEVYAYDQEKDKIEVESIQYSTFYYPYHFMLDELDTINKFMLFTDSSLIDFDKLFEKLDLKLVEMV